MSRDSATGTTVGGFRVGEPIGARCDGRASTWPRAARGGALRSSCSRPSSRTTSASGSRFLRESQLAATLDHPHVVRTIAAGEDGGVLYLAMAYVEGVDLRELLRLEGALDPEHAVRLVRQVGDALDAAHAAGLVHRDVKPGNVLVDGDRALRVRLRHRPARLVGRQPHRRPRLRRNGRLRRTRADPRRAGRRVRRRLRARLRALRVPRRANGRSSAIPSSPSCSRI